MMKAYKKYIVLTIDGKDIVKACDFKDFLKDDSEVSGTHLVGSGFYSLFSAVQDGKMRDGFVSIKANVHKSFFGKFKRSIQVSFPLVALAEPTVLRDNGKSYQWEYHTYYKEFPISMKNLMNHNADLVLKYLEDRNQKLDVTMLGK